MMHRQIALAALAATLLGGTAGAGELKQIGAIAVPGQALTNFDISAIDQGTGRYYLSDWSNRAVDVVDTNADRYLGRAEGFVGVVMKDGKASGALSGPDGLLTTGQETWAGDGDSTFKVIDPATMTVTATIPTGGKNRVDEMAFDADDRIVMGINNAETPPYATLVSSDAAHRVIGKLSFPDATDGAEQPAYNPADHLFYLSIPELGKDARKGGVAVIDPKTATLVKMLPVDGCRPSGLAFGPDGNFLLGCAADGKTMPAITVIMNARTGGVVAIIPGLGGSDEVNYNSKNNQYYTASRDNPGGPALGVIDAASNSLVQTVAITGGTPHSVTSSEATGHVYVPVGATGGGDGTIHVYAPVP